MSEVGVARLPLEFNNEHTTERPAGEGVSFCCNALRSSEMDNSEPL